MSYLDDEQARTVWVAGTDHGYAVGKSVMDLPGKPVVSEIVSNLSGAIYDGDDVWEHLPSGIDSTPMTPTVEDLCPVADPVPGLVDEVRETYSQGFLSGFIAVLTGDEGSRS